MESLNNPIVIILVVCSLIWLVYEHARLVPGESNPCFIRERDAS